MLLYSSPNRIPAAGGMTQESPRESQPELQQLVPGIAFDHAFDDAIDLGGVLERGEQCGAREVLRGAAHERLARIAQLPGAQNERLP